MAFSPEKVHHILSKVPSLYRGPGGAIAVLKDGNLVGQKVWGYADMDQRALLSSETLIPICSITKQFASMLLFELTNDPPPTMSSEKGNFQEQMLAKLRETAPSEFVDKHGLTVDNLVDMCSGIRDYWALCTLQGSRPETMYSLREHNPGMLRRLKSLHFEPGTEYSYSNTNFNILERLLEEVTGDTFEKLLDERILQPAKMDTAGMCPQTNALPPPIVGYEGTEKSGFRSAPNYIEWSADAGMIASLEDMIAYERYFDSKYVDVQSGYREKVAPGQYKNGAQAQYRYGLRHDKVGGFSLVGHGGALRGYKLARRYVEEERLSVVVLFNHHASAAEAAEYIIKQILGIAVPETFSIEPAKEWFGSFLDQDTQLAVRVSPTSEGKIELLYSRAHEKLRLVAADRAQSPNMLASIAGDCLTVHRIDENRILNANRMTTHTDTSTRSPVQGTYKCEELESTFICEGEDDMLYALFNGPFGRGPPHLMTYLGDDVWVFANPRAMDDQAPGDWTLVFVRDEQGVVSKVIIGCWLARKLEFIRKRSS